MAGLRNFVVFAAALFLAGATQAQELGGAHRYNLPPEFEGRVSCQRLIAARTDYLSRPRPAFNCMSGVDCPEDLTPAPPVLMDPFVLYYDVDASQRTLDIDVDPINFLVVARVIELLLQDMDRVSRSRTKTIHVVGHSDAFNVRRAPEISDLMGQCVGAMIDISMHLNGYRGAYDFNTIVESKGDSDLAQPTARGVAEPLNRRAHIEISY